MKNTIRLLSAAAIIAAAVLPAFAQEQVSFKLLGGLAWIQGDDYNRGVLGETRYAAGTSASMSGRYKELKNGGDLQFEIVNYWGSHLGVGIGGGYYRLTNTSGISGTAPASDPTYEYTSSFTPKISAIPLYVNVHYRTRLAPRIGLDVFAGPVFQVVEVNFKREATSSLDSLSETETFNASRASLGAQAGLSCEVRLFRGVSLVLDAFYRAAKISKIKGNWFLSTTTESSGTTTSSSDSYSLWTYRDTGAGGHDRIGLFDENGPTGEFVSEARKAEIKLSGPALLIGFKFAL